MTKTGLTIVPQPSGWSYDPTKGYKTKRSYKGTGKDNLATTESELKLYGWTYDVQLDLDTGADVMWTITATLGGDSSSSPSSPAGQDVTTPLSETWELSSNLLEKDLLESDAPLMVALWNEALAGNGWTHEQDFTNRVTALKAFGENPTKEGLVIFTGFPVMLKIAKILAAGGKSIHIFQPTLRHNRIVTSKYAVRDALINCGNIITAADIGSAENIPATLLFNLPTGYHSARYLDNTGDELGRLLKYGWQKKFPNIGSRADGEWELSQEFEWGLWHTDLYTFA